MPGKGGVVGVGVLDMVDAPETGSVIFGACGKPAAGPVDKKTDDDVFVALEKGDVGPEILCCC